jgi:predicted DNA-binding ribbon-helix-helix protein
MWCPRSIAAILASYIVQSELGDYDVNEHPSGYLNDFRFVPFQNLEFENEVHLYQKQARGLSPADAEVYYLRVASTLDMYGVELHKTSVKVSNANNSIYNSIVELYVGVCANGITVFQNSTKLNTFSWDQITKISFKRRTFYVQLIKNLDDSSDDNSIVFTLRNYHCCKYLWKSCVDHHTFFRLTAIPSSPKEYYQYSNEKKCKSFERVSSRRNIRSSTLPISSTDKNFLFNQNSNLFHSTLNIPKLDKLPPPKPPRQPLIEMNEYKLNNVIAHSLQVKLKPDIDGR